MQLYAYYIANSLFYLFSLDVLNETDRSINSYEVEALKAEVAGLSSLTGKTIFFQFNKFISTTINLCTSV